MSRRLVDIRAEAWPYLLGPDSEVAWDEIGRIQRREEGPTRMLPGTQGYLQTIMPNGDPLIWASDDLDERFAVLFVGPLKDDPD